MTKAPTFTDSNRRTFVRIVHASYYNEGWKGLMMEVVEWDRAFAYSTNGKCGDFENGEWHTPIPAWYNMDSILAYAHSEGIEPIIAL